MDLRLFHTSSCFWEHYVISNYNFKLTLILKAKAVLVNLPFKAPHCELKPLHFCVWLSNESVGRPREGEKLILFG